MHDDRTVTDLLQRLAPRAFLGLVTAMWGSFALVILAAAIGTILFASGDLSGAAAARAIAWIATAATLLSLIALVTLLSLREWIRATDDLQDTEFVGQTQQRSDR
jgi:hypothetical protein